MADEIIRIADTVDQERKQRLDGEETLLKRLNDEVYRLTDIIAQEQTTRKVQRGCLLMRGTGRARCRERILHMIWGGRVPCGYVVKVPS